jgi:hypothetical protein
MKKGEKNKTRDDCHYVAHLAQPAQLHIDLNSAIHEQHQTHAALPRPWTHPAAARHHELSTQQETKLRSSDVRSPEPDRA